MKISSFSHYEAIYSLCKHAYFEGRYPVLKFTIALNYIASRVMLSIRRSWFTMVLKGPDIVDTPSYGISDVSCIFKGSLPSIANPPLGKRNCNQEIQSGIFCQTISMY